MNRVINCILCGGAGTRLWPLSRQKMPKQFIPLFQGRSLFQDTVRRNASVCDEIMVISNVGMLHLAKQQMEKEGQQGRFLLEPIGRNSAPALGLGAMLLSPDDIVVVTTSDHVIVNTIAFEQAVVLPRARRPSEKLRRVVCVMGAPPVSVRFFGSAFKFTPIPDGCH